MKRLSEQTNVDKAENLHQLFPHQINPYLVFVQEKIKTIRNKPEQLTEVLATDITPEKWLGLLQIINETIDKDYSRLLTNSSFFSIHLFRGYIGVFTIHCLQEYMSLCNDDQFFKAVELFFDI